MITKNRLISLLLVPIIGFIMFILNIDALMILIVMVWSTAVLFFSVEYEKNIFFLCFLFSFFIFLISGDLVEQLFQTKYWMRFSDDSTLHSRICILVSLLSLLCGYVVTKNGKKEIDCDDLNTHINTVSEVSKIAYYLTSIPLLSVSLERVVFSSVFGYDELYLSYYSIFPRVFVKIGDFAPIALCIFLGTMPIKKKAELPIVLYLIYAVLGLFSGQRGVFVYNAAFLLAYVIFRNYAYNNGDVWFKKRYLFVLILSLPFMFSFLMIVQFLRNGGESTYNSMSEAFVAFFTNIGSASKILKLGYEHKNSLQDFRFYSLGDTITYFKFSDVFTFIFGTTAPEMHTSEYAMSCNNFGEVLTYLVFPSQYRMGYGLGSCFIAELYADFNYLGIVIGSYIYGVILKKMSIMNANSYIANFVKLFIMLWIIKAPRGEYDKFIVGFVNVVNLLFIVMIFVISSSIENRRNKKRRSSIYIR